MLARGTVVVGRARVDGEAVDLGVLVGLLSEVFADVAGVLVGVTVETGFEAGVLAAVLVGVEAFVVLSATEAVLEGSAFLAEEVVEGRAERIGERVVLAGVAVEDDLSLLC